MKSWYDLERQEQKELKQEFDKKIKRSHIIYIRKILVGCMIAFAFLTIISFYVDNQMECYQNACKKNGIKLGILFGVSLGLFLLADFYQSCKNNKAFISWLETSKRIKK